MDMCGHYLFNKIDINRPDGGTMTTTVTLFVNNFGTTLVDSKAFFRVLKHINHAVVDLSSVWCCVLCGFVMCVCIQITFDCGYINFHPREVLLFFCLQSHIRHNQIGKYTSISAFIYLSLQVIMTVRHTVSHLGWMLIFDNGVLEREEWLSNEDS